MGHNTNTHVHAHTHAHELRAKVARVCTCVFCAFLLSSVQLGAGSCLLVFLMKLLISELKICTTLHLCLNVLIALEQTRVENSRYLAELPVAAPTSEFLDR